MWEDLLARIPSNTKGRPRRQAPLPSDKMVDINVSQGVVNVIMDIWADAREAQGADSFRLTLEAGDGHMDVRACAKGAIGSVVESRFEVVSAQISRTNQVLVLRGIGPWQEEGAKWRERIAQGVGAGLFSVIFQRSPVDQALGRHLEISEDGDQYRISLQEAGLVEILQSAPLIQEALERFEVCKVSCVPNGFVITAKLLG